MNGTDPYKLFKQLDPSRGLDPNDIEQRNADVLREILQQPRHSKSAARSRRRSWLLGGGLAVVVLATAAFAFIRASTVSDPLAVSCMATNDLDSDTVALRSSNDPVSACGELWETGVLGTGEVPDLSGCVNATGAAVVFPSTRDICGRLGLAELEPGLTDEQRIISSLEDSLVTAFAGGCYEQAAAVDEAQRQLDETGLEDWTVSAPEPFAEDATCAVGGVDIAAQQIIVIGGRTR